MVLFVYCCLTMRVLPHSNHGAMSMESTVEPESTWMIEVRDLKGNMDDDIEVDAFLIDLKTHLHNDGCMLHTSKNSKRLIVLIIHCPAIIMEDEEQEVKTLRLLDTEAYVNDIFHQSVVKIYKNGIFSVRYKKSRLTQQIQSKSKVNIKGASLYEAFDVQENAGWNLERISERTRNDQVDGYLYNSDGQGIDVYILDTGIMAEHEEFDNKRATFLYNAVRDGITTDCNGHGTHVAGIIGSRTYGVAKKVHLYGVRVLNCSGDGTIDDILEGADAIIDQYEKQPPAQRRRGVINLSLGGDKSATIERMVKSLREAGLIVILAAGNSGSDACEFSPSNMGLGNYALTVGASDRNDQRPAWSNYGACVSITAPGKDITSTWFTSKTSIATISGTSMAAPAVTGVAALVLQQLIAHGTVGDEATLVDRVNQLIVRWATPNVIGDTPTIGGGKSLLFSRVDVKLAPGEVKKIIDTIPTQRLVTNDSVGSGSGLILCIALTFLWFACIV